MTYCSPDSSLLVLQAPPLSSAPSCPTSGWVHFTTFKPPSCPACHRPSLFLGQEFAGPHLPSTTSSPSYFVLHSIGLLSSLLDVHVCVDMHTCMSEVRRFTYGRWRWLTHECAFEGPVLTLVSSKIVLCFLLRSSLSLDPELAGVS